MKLSKIIQSIKNEARIQISKMLQEAIEKNQDEDFDYAAQSWMDARSNKGFLAVIAKTSSSNEKSPVKDGIIGNGWSKIGSPVTITNPKDKRLADMIAKKRELSSKDKTNKYRIVRLPIKK